METKSGREAEDEKVIPREILLILSSFIHSYPVDSHITLGLMEIRRTKKKKMFGVSSNGAVRFPVRSLPLGMH